MKKFLSIMMTLVMLLSVCAFAEATEPTSGKITLGDIVICEGETAILDLTGLDVSISAYEGEVTGVQLAVSADDKEVAALNVAMDDEKILLSMTDIADVYSLDISSVAEEMGVEAEVVTELSGEELLAALGEENMAALTEIVEEVINLIAAGTADAGTEEIDGVTYKVTTINVTAEQFAPVIQKIAAFADSNAALAEQVGEESFVQIFEEIQPGLAIDGAIFEAETVTAFDFIVNGTAFTGTEEEIGGFVDLYVDCDTSDETKAAMFVAVTIGADDLSYTLSFNLDVETENDSSWMPASDAPVDLMAVLADEAQSQQLALQATSVITSALSEMAAANETFAVLLGAVMAE